MTSTLVNHVVSSGIDFYEYIVSFTSEPIPGEQILVGLDYVSRNIIAELRGEQVVVGLMPTTTNTPFRLVLTIEVQGSNSSYIPYEVFFNFSEDTNEYTQTLINPFIERIPRPVFDVTHDTVILDDEFFYLEYFSDATQNVTIEILNSLSVIVFSSLVNNPISGNTSSDNIMLPVGNYTVNVVGYNEPLIYSTYVGTFIVNGAEKFISIENLYENMNTFFTPIIVMDELPIITFTNITILSSNSIELTYQTINADFVDIITSFGQDYNNISANGTLIFNNLTVNILYDLTIIAKDTNSNEDIKNLEFTIIVNIVNNTKGILGLKRGKEL